MEPAHLLSALSYLISNMGLMVTAIQFEDGSGKKFNYQVDGNSQWHFIDLTNSTLYNW